MVSCSQEVAPNQNEYIRGPSGYIIHIWSNFGFSDTSYITTFLPAQMSVVKPEVYCIYIYTIKTRFKYILAPSAC